MFDNAELWVYLIGSILLMIGAFGLIGAKVLGKKLRIFKYMMVAGAIGFVTIPVAFIVAAVRGNISIFVQSLADSPLGVFTALGEDGGYTDACINGKCADTCCTSITNPSDRWKDCNQECNSKPNTRGRMIGTGCRFSANMPLYCDGASNVDAQQTSSVCNNIPELGPITCTCCISSETKEKYWDCDARCASHPKEVGFRTSNSQCSASTSQLYCNKNTTVTDNVSDNTSNSQSF